MQAPANDPSYARFLWWLSFLRSEFHFVTARSYICATQHAAAHRAMRPTQAPESARPDSANHPSIRVSSARFGKHLSIRVSPARYGKPSVHPSQSGTLRANPAHLHARDMTTLLSHSLVLSLSHSLSHTPLSLSLSLLSHSLTLFSLFLLNPKPLHSLSTTSFPLSYSVPFFVPLPFFCPLILSIEPTQDET